MTEINLAPGSVDWKKMRRLATESIPGKHSALYYFNEKIRGLGPLVPMTYRAHFAMCLFAEGATGIPEIDSARIKLIMVSRGVGKSSLITKGLPLLKTCQDPEYAMGIANEIAEMAESFLGETKAEIQTNVLLQTLWPEIIPEDFGATIWRSDRIITKRQKLNPTSPTIIATGVGGTKVGIHQNGWICDDLLSKNAAEALRRGSVLETESTNQWIVQLQPLLKNPMRDPIWYVGCIAENEPVLMAAGTWTSIQDIKLGDEVWACKKDGSEGFKARKVTGVWPQGEAEIVEVDIAGRQLRCTPNHPILTSWGRSDGVGRHWRDADSLGRASIVFASMENDAPITDEDYETAWLLGFMIGDGWVTKYKRKDGTGIQWSIHFSPGVDEDLNKHVCSALQKRFSQKLYKNRVGTMRMDSKAAGEAFVALGLKPGCGAKNKRVPAWIFKASLGIKHAFLRGLGDADGHWNHAYRYTLEVASEGLAQDVHKLAMTCGVRPSRITSRTRMSQAPHSPVPIEATSYCVALNFVAKEGWVHRHWVKSIKHQGVSKVYDLTVEEGDCAFVASGVVVGNTKWWDGDSYEFIEEFHGYGEERRDFVWTLRLPRQYSTWRDGTKDKIIDRKEETQVLKLHRRGDIAVFRMPARDENGRPVFPERLDEDELRKLEEQDPVFFGGQYLLDATSGGVNDFKQEWLGTYEWEGDKIRIQEGGSVEYIHPKELTCFASVDPAFSKKSSAARSAIPVTGLDGRRIFLLEDYAQRGISEDDIAAKVMEFFTRYKMRNIKVETITAQVMVANALRRRFREAKMGEPPLDEIPSWGKQRKELRVFGLQHYFKRKLFYVHRSQVDFLREYLSFPRGTLRDILDALAFQVEDWEKIFKLTHYSGGTPMTPEDIQKRDADGVAKAKAAWGRRRRR